MSSANFEGTFHKLAPMAHIFNGQNQSLPPHVTFLTNIRANSLSQTLHGMFMPNQNLLNNRGLFSLARTLLSILHQQPETHHDRHRPRTRPG